MNINQSSGLTFLDFTTLNNTFKIKYLRHSLIIQNRYEILFQIMFSLKLVARKILYCVIIISAQSQLNCQTFILS